jgi:hypothetical protein
MPTINARSSLQFGRIKMPAYRRLSKDGAVFFAIDAATRNPIVEFPGSISLPASVITSDISSVKRKLGSESRFLTRGAANMILR